MEEGMAEVLHPRAAAVADRVTRHRTSFIFALVTGVNKRVFRRLCRHDDEVGSAVSMRRALPASASTR